MTCSKARLLHFEIRPLLYLKGHPRELQTDEAQNGQLRQKQDACNKVVLVHYVTVGVTAKGFSLHVALTLVSVSTSTEDN
jgi:hypothetical protein